MTTFYGKCNEFLEKGWTNIQVMFVNRIKYLLITLALNVLAGLILKWLNQFPAISSLDCSADLMASRFHLQSYCVDTRMVLILLLYAYIPKCQTITY